MDVFQKKFLRATVSEYDNLSELEKQTGVATTVLARLLAPEIDVDSSIVDTPDYQGSEIFHKILNTERELVEGDFIYAVSALPISWLRPTSKGRDLVRQWREEDQSPVYQGKRILKYIYGPQQHVSPVHRRVGKAGQVDLEALCSELDMDYDTYLKGANWAKRQGHLAEPSVDQFSVENGGIYITDAGMTAVEDEFKEEGAGITQTVSVYNSTVYGSVMATGRDALVISHPALAAVGDDIRSVLASIQDAIEQLPEESDERHEALQELHTLTRELSKQEPVSGRVERAIGNLGSVAGIASLLVQLQELLRNLLS